MDIQTEFSRWYWKHFVMTIMGTWQQNCAAITWDIRYVSKQRGTALCKGINILIISLCLIWSRSVRQLAGTSRRGGGLQLAYLHRYRQKGSPRHSKRRTRTQRLQHLAPQRGRPKTIRITTAQIMLGTTCSMLYESKCSLLYSSASSCSKTSNNIRDDTTD